jgi:hypothetical protein
MKNTTEIFSEADEIIWERLNSCSSDGLNSRPYYVEDDKARILRNLHTNRLCLKCFYSYGVEENHYVEGEKYTNKSCFCNGFILNEGISNGFKICDCCGIEVVMMPCRFCSKDLCIQCISLGEKPKNKANRAAWQVTHPHIPNVTYYDVSFIGDWQEEQVRVLQQSLNFSVDPTFYQFMLKTNDLTNSGNNFGLEYKEKKILSLINYYKNKPNQ